MRLGHVSSDTLTWQVAAVLLKVDASAGSDNAQSSRMQHHMKARGELQFMLQPLPLRACSQ